MSLQGIKTPIGKRSSQPFRGTVPGNRAVSQVASEETPELELTRSQNRFGRLHGGRAGGAWGREGLYLRRMGNCGLPPTQETEAVFKYCNSRM